MYRKTPYINEKNGPVKSIRLWSDWNKGIKDWAEQKVSSAEDSSFRYLNIHTEDLVSEDKHVKFNAMKRLGDFVGTGILFLCSAH